MSAYVIPVAAWIAAIGAAIAAAVAWRLSLALRAALCRVEKQKAALRLVQPVLAEDLECLERSYLPSPNPEEMALLLQVREAIKAVDAALESHA